MLAPKGFTSHDNIAYLFTPNRIEAVTAADNVGPMGGGGPSWPISYSIDQRAHLPGSAAAAGADGHAASRV